MIRLLTFIVLFSFGLLAGQPDLKENKPENTAGNTVKILPLGNSITFDNRENDTRNIGEKAGYRYPLYQMLKNAGFNFDFIGSEHSGGSLLPAGYDENAGFPGITDDQLLNLLQTGRLVQLAQGIERQITGGPYLNTYAPDLILLHIGTNNNEIPGGTSPDEVEQILDEIDNYENNSGNEVIVLLARIIDRVPNESFVTEFNDNIEQMALDRVNNPSNDAYPDNILIVDMEDSAGFNYIISPDPDGAPGDMNDSAHPNDKGYAKMAQQWFNAIAEVLPNPPKITSDPVTQFTIEGSRVVFSVTAESEQSILYQWRKNGSNIPLANKQELVLSSVSESDNNSEYSCLVSNINGSVLSKSAKLFVNSREVRVSQGKLAEYDFQEGAGNVIYNLLGNDLLDLEINNIESINWIEDGIDILNSADISTINSAEIISDSIINSNSFSFELWFRTDQLDQIGPARIVTLSNSDNERNFTVGQNSEHFVIRTRTSETNLDGIPDFESENGFVTDELTHLIITRDNAGIQKIYLNSVLSDSALITGDLSNWNSAYKLAIGNEFQSNKPWVGAIYYLAIFNRDLSNLEVEHNFSLGEDGITSVKSINLSDANTFELFQNYPNPFNPSTTISFSLKDRSSVSLKLYNPLGEVVKSIFENSFYSPGLYSVKLNAEDLPSGIYFYQIIVNTLNHKQQLQKSKKLTIIK